MKMMMKVARTHEGVADGRAGRAAERMARRTLIGMPACKVKVRRCAQGIDAGRLRHRAGPGLAGGAGLIAAPFNITGRSAKLPQSLRLALRLVGQPLRALRVYRTPVMSCAPHHLRARPALTRCSARRALGAHGQRGHGCAVTASVLVRRWRAVSRSTRPTHPGPVCCARLQPPSASSRPVLAAKPSPGSEQPGAKQPKPNSLHGAARRAPSLARDPHPFVGRGCASGASQ